MPNFSETISGGNDWLDYRDYTSPASRALPVIGGNPSFSIHALDGNDTLLSATQNGPLYGRNDSLYGDGGNDWISTEGSLGNHLLDGGEGNDTIVGYGRSLTINGGSGNDNITFYGKNGGIEGAFPTGLLDGGDGNDSIQSETNSNTIYGGDGDDTISVSSSQIPGYVPPTYSNSKGNVINGGSGNDSILTSVLADSVDGGSGNDTIRGNFGDTLLGGAGDDNIEIYHLTLGMDKGAMYLSGGEGNDTITITNVYSVVGSTIEGGKGNDLLVSAGGIISGGAGADTLRGTFEKGTTVDYSASASAVTVVLGQPSSQWTVGFGQGGDAEGDQLHYIAGVIGSWTGDNILGNATAESLNGGGGNDYIVGNDGSDWLMGGSGRDTLIGGRTESTLADATDLDTADYSGSASGVNIDLSGGRAIGGDAEGDVLSGIENLVGSRGNDTLVGNIATTRLDGGAGNDLLIVRGINNATVIGGEGEDKVVLSSHHSGLNVNLAQGKASDVSGPDYVRFTLTGIEAVEGSNYNDTLTGTDGANTLIGGLGGDFMEGGKGADSIVGDGGATDFVNYLSSRGGVSVDLGGAVGRGQFNDAQGDTIVGVNNVNGSAYGDVLAGNANANVLNGREGEDALYGRAGNDVLYGEKGNDKLYGEEGDDTLNGGDGSDYLAGGTGKDFLNGGLGNDTVDYSGSASGVNVSLSTGRGVGGDAEGDSLSGVDNLIGSWTNDTLTGDNNANLLNGGGGNDKIDAGGGNDMLMGGSGKDTLNGGNGNDTADYSDSQSSVNVSITTGRGYGGYAEGDVLFGVDNLIGSWTDDWLEGDQFANRLNGGGGNDTLAGGSGNDTLTGNSGSDRFSGGSGSDVFVVSLAQQGERDVVTDYVDGTDRIQLSGMSFGQLSLTNTSQGALISSAGGGQVVLAGINAGVLTASDFLFT